MGITITVKLDTSRLDAIIQAAPGVENVVAERGAQMVKRMARSIVSVDTGATRSSIDYVMIADGAAIVWALTAWALYLEMGTSKMAARPYMVPSLNAVPWVSLLREAFREVGL